MALCINQSGTWRNITTQCVNESGTWRKVATGCINQSGTWRKFGFPSISDPFSTSCPLGSPTSGGYLICKSSNVAWIVAPNTTEVSRTWYCRNDANTIAQQVSGCTGWFVPTVGQLQNPGYICVTYWDSFSSFSYWSNTEISADRASVVAFNAGGNVFSNHKTHSFNVRAFRCVTY